MPLRPEIRDILAGRPGALGDAAGCFPFVFGFPRSSRAHKSVERKMLAFRDGGGGQGRYGYRRSTLYALESTDHVSFYTWYCTCRVYPMRLAIQNVHGCPESRVHPPGGRGVNGAVNVQLKQANVFYFLLFRKVQ